MIQHINLLSKRSRAQGLEWLTVSALVLVVLALLGFAAVAEWRLYRLAQAEAETTAQVAQLKSVLEKKRRDAGFDEIQALSRQTAALRSQMDAQREWSDLLQKGELGSRDGYSHMFDALARLHEEGVWLQGLDVSKGGQSVSISGKSLNTESIMRYIAQVNEAFKPMGLQFSSIELTQEAATGEPAKAGLLKFKLY